jgi:RimJ/RimL family protein N-acetyltransferase
VAGATARLTRMARFALYRSGTESWGRSPERHPPPAAGVARVAGLFHLEWTNRSAEFGIFIGDKSLWDKGYGTEVLQVFLQHAFDTLNLNRIYLRVFATNARARRSYEKVGLAAEGTMRQAVFRNGQYIDVHVMSILSSEWRKGREGT